MKRKPEPRELPSNPEVEQALIGAIFVNNAAFHAVSGIVTADHFYEPLHRKIFEVTAEMIRMGKVVTPITIKTFLPADEPVGDITVWEYLIRLLSAAVTVVNAPDYAREVVAIAYRRQLVIVGEDLIKEATEAPVEVEPQQIGDQAQARLFDLRLKEGRSSVISTAERTADRMLSEGAIVPPKFVPLPLPQMTEIMGGGLESGNLYGMLSSSGEGKTSLVLQCMEYAARNGHPALMLSYDQSDEQCFRQIASQRVGIESSRLKDVAKLQTVDQERYANVILSLRGLPLAFKKCSGRYDGSAQLAGYALHFLSTFASKFPDKPPLIILDHVRKVKPRNERDHEGRIAAEVNGMCKDVAAESGAVWLNLNQRNSFGMRRKNPRPIPSDVFGGEQGVEDYDGIFYLYRAQKYWNAQIATADDAKDEERINARFTRERWEPDEAEIGALKVRFATPTRSFRVRFEAEFTRYVSKRPVIADELFAEAG